MNIGNCLLCFSENVKTYDIQGTHLQYVYEEITDLEIQAKSHNTTTQHNLCYCCHVKLQQCYNLLKRSRNIQVEHVPLVQLCTKEVSHTSIPYDCVTIKEEPGVKEESLLIVKTELEIEDNSELRKIKEVKKKRSKRKTALDKEKSYTCDICKKNFINTGNLNRHKQIHSGVKQFSCDICNKKFSEKKYIKTHKLTHSGVKPFTCDVCNKKFVQIGHLNRHKLSHSNVRSYSCDICEKKFILKSHLNTHMVTHSDVKSFSCEICTKQFNNKNYLKIHKLSHTGVKAYNCGICNKKFIHASSLNRHKQTHVQERKLEKSKRTQITPSKIFKQQCV